MSIKLNKKTQLISLNLTPLGFFNGVTRVKSSAMNQTTLFPSDVFILIPNIKEPYVQQQQTCNKH